jgi:16S rRNA (guanine1207-N2)-methyltransferase
MRADRLSHAVDSGALLVPGMGRIAIFGPAAPQDLTVFPRDRVQVITRQRLDHDAFVMAGYEVVPSATAGAAMALVCASRARVATQALVADATACLGPSGTLVLDGQKIDGIDTLIRAVAARATVSTPVIKAHGRLVVVGQGADFTDWRAMPQTIEAGFITRPGVFSADAPDPASVLLAGALPAKLGSRVVDLGAGWGYLARAILTRDTVLHLDLVEADGVALDCARDNITDPRAQFHWSDALTFKPAAPAHSVVCNPPFHTTRQADPALGAAFIRAAQAMLTAEGTLWLVANRHLPYDPVLAAAFREVTDIGSTSAYRLIRASRPHRPTKKN